MFAGTEIPITKERTMKFEAEIDLNYRQLLALYQVSERLFRRWQMLLFRVV